VSRILIGQSYYLRFDAKLWEAMQPYPPLGSLYAAAVLRRKGHEVALFDAMLARSEEDWGAALTARRPDLAVIFEDNFNYLSKMCLLRMRAAAFRMLDMAKAQRCTTIACGSDATDNPERYLRQGADVVVLGEGEATLAALLDPLVDPVAGDLRHLRGVAFLGPDGDVVSTGRRENQKELDTLPFPAWDLLDLEPYRQAWLRHGRFSLNMATTRGCPFHCNWCAKPIWGQRFAVRSPENVVDELELLRATVAPDHINFVDDIFGLKPGWTRTYADLVRSRGAVTPFKCLGRADLLLRSGEIEALRDAGCETVWIGAESGSQQVLDAMEKGTRVEQIREASTLLRQAGIRRGFFLQFGYPGEGLPEIEATRRLVRDCNPDDIGISVSYPLPGTRFHERVRSQLGERRNWVDSGDLAMLYEGPFSTDYYRRLHSIVHKEFRLNNAAGTVSPVTHLRRAATGRPSREGLARLRDALTLPIELRRLDRRGRLELQRPRPRRPAA
jgi:anaerobic magnesium-protoporphyrin IX monomethyl ester cyclase